MLVVPLQKSLFDHKTGLNLGGRPIGVLNNLVVINRKEVSDITTTASFIWRTLCHLSGTQKFLGMIRFDLIPEFTSSLTPTIWRGRSAFNLGEPKIRGFYEINGHSPECGAGTAALHLASPEHLAYQPNATKLIASKLSKTFGGAIHFVQGTGTLKDSWGPFFVEALKNAGLNLEPISTEKAMCTDPEILWRWGDARLLGHSEFPVEFIQWLNRRRRVTFNSMPNGVDITGKNFLFPIGVKTWDSLVGKSFFLSNEEAVQIALRCRPSLVLKPLGGSSGIGIYFGRLMNDAEWEQKVLWALQMGNHGLFEARWLPKVELGDFGEIAIDFNPTFWATGTRIEYLYSVVRALPYDVYEKELLINVSQRGGWGGTVVVDDGRS